MRKLTYRRWLIVHCDLVFCIPVITTDRHTTFLPQPQLTKASNFLRIPNTAASECFPWDGAIGTATDLQAEFNAITPSTGSVVVRRTGDKTATSAYGYNYDIDFAGVEVRGDMDLR